jgi:hypothetical protein
MEGAASSRAILVFCQSLAKMERNCQTLAKLRFLHADAKQSARLRKTGGFRLISLRSVRFSAASTTSFPCPPEAAFHGFQCSIPANVWQKSGNAAESAA